MDVIRRVRGRTLPFPSAALHAQIEHDPVRHRTGIRSAHHPVMFFVDRRCVLEAGADLLEPLDAVGDRRVR
jgi:hypothetical protein